MLARAQHGLACRYHIKSQDVELAKIGAEFLAQNALLREVEGFFYVPDLLLDFIKMKCRSEGMHSLVEDAVRRQAKYLSQPSVVREFEENEGLGTNLYSLTRLWRSLEELSGNDQLEVETYRDRLREVGEAESTDVADMHALIGRLFHLEVSYWYAFQAHIRPELTCVRRLGTAFALFRLDANTPSARNVRIDPRGVRRGKSKAVAIPSQVHRLGGRC